MGTWTISIFLVLCYHYLLVDIAHSQSIESNGYSSPDVAAVPENSNQPNGLVDSEFVQECTANKSVDLLLILDGSGSIGDETFKSQISFAMSLAQRLNVSDSGSHLAVIQYAESPRLEFSLDQYNHPTQLEWAIQRINYMSGATNTGRSLKLALEKGFKGARGGAVPKVAVVITDGQSQDDVAEPSQLLRDSHVMLYAIGVTNLINVHQLHQITGNPLRVFTVESFEELDRSLVDSLTWDMCKSEFRPGTPDIICGPDRIGVRASTKEPFDGYVFVMDHFHDKKCRAGPESFDDSRSIGLAVPFSACNVHRYRSLNPKGIFVEVTFVFMFHSLFMTKSDQMIKVQCFYMEAQKQVTVPLSVSMITTQFREQIYQMPQCTYTLRKDGPDGEIVKFASLGEKVYHRWECVEVEQKDTFGMLVHSCYVDNGFGDRVDVLDENGCGLDFVILRTPEYDSSLRLATIATWVFKYADRPVLQFQCQITLCLKYDNGCSEITPPRNCPKPKHEHGNFPKDVELMPATTTLSPRRSGTESGRGSTPQQRGQATTSSRPVGNATPSHTQIRNQPAHNTPNNPASVPPSISNSPVKVQINRTIGSGSPARAPPEFNLPKNLVPPSNRQPLVKNKGGNNIDRGQNSPPGTQPLVKTDTEEEIEGRLQQPQRHSEGETPQNEISGYNRRRIRLRRRAAGYGTIDVFTDKITVLDQKFQCENASFGWQATALIASATAANILIFLTSCVIWMRLYRKKQYAL